MRNRLIAAALIGAALSMPGLGQQTSIAARANRPGEVLRPPASGTRVRRRPWFQPGLADLQLLDAAEAKRQRKGAKRLADAARAAERRHPFERAAAALATEY